MIEGAAAHRVTGHLKFDKEIRSKVLLMSAATIDRVLRLPRRMISSVRDHPPIRQRLSTGQ